MDTNAFLALQNWGSVPEWFGAVGTIGAVVVALSFGLRDHKRLVEERKEATADRELFRQERLEQANAQKRSLAAKVTLIVEKMPGVHPSLEGPRQHIAVTVHNASDEPISLVSVVQRLRPGAPGSDKVTGEILKTWPAIEAGSSRTHTFDSYRDPSDYEHQREVQFTDGAAQRWLRKELGFLRAIDGDDPDAFPMVLLQA